MNNPIYRRKIDNVVPMQRPKNKIKRAYGWDCPFKDFTSNRHYNTQRHIYSIHGIGSGEPVDHRTEETREEKIRAANGSHTHPMNTSVNSRTCPVFPPVRDPGNCPDTISAAYSIRMPYLEAQEHRIKELGYTVPGHNYGQHPRGAAGWTNTPRYLNVSPTNRFDNAIDHFSSQTNQLHNSQYSTNPINPRISGPFDDCINAMILYKGLRRCFR